VSALVRSYLTTSTERPGSEPEAAAVHCAYLTDLHKLGQSQNFMICDAGGGTVVSRSPHDACGGGKKTPYQCTNPSSGLGSCRV
jgi:hypothetical protein